MTPQASQVLEPRKSPVQARSSATVDAILEATVQVLLAGKDRLTTTRVAHRAGVSVGTLYQYFPNKGALLQAALRRHLLDVAETIERACQQQHGKRLAEMATALISAFLEAKMRDVKKSVALYTVSSDLNAAKIVQQTGGRAKKAIAAMLASSCQQLHGDLRLIASMLQGAMVGVSRRLLESNAPEKQLDAVREELIFLACSYLNACSTRHP